MGDRQFGTVNYYEILDLDPSVDPVRDKTKIRGAITVRCKASSGDVKTKIRIVLAASLAKQMETDLASPDIWEAFREDRRKALRMQDLAQRKMANHFFDVLGDSLLTTVARKNILKHLKEIGGSDPEKLLAEVMTARKVVDSNDGASGKKGPSDFEKTVSRARGLVAMARYLCEVHQAEDLYVLASRFTAHSFSAKSSNEEMAAVVAKVRINWRYKNDKARKAVYDHFEEVAHVVFPATPKTAKDPAVSVRRVFDELLALDKAVYLLGTVEMLRYVDRVRSDQVDQIVARGAAQTGIDQARVRRIVEALMVKASIDTFRSAAPQNYRVCIQCGVLGLPEVEVCGSCKFQFMANCINCNTQFDRSLAACPTCGTTVTAGQADDNKLVEAGVYLDAGDLKAAERVLKVLAASIPRSERRTKMANRLATELRTSSKELAEIEQLATRDHRIFEAQDRLSRASGRIDASIVAVMKKDLSTAVAEARKLTVRAKEHLATGDGVRAELLASQALSLVADDTDAQAILNAIPPPPVTRLEALKQTRAIHLEWRAPKGQARALEYVIVRSEGRSPKSPSDGNVLAKQEQCFFTDRTCRSGVGLYYAVFTYRNGVFGTSDGVGPVMLLAPVADLTAKSSEDSVTLTWTLPDGASNAEIRRGDPKVSMPVLLEQDPVTHVRDRWTDTEMAPGVPHRYHVTACYIDENGEVLRASPEMQLAASARTPSGIQRFVHNPKTGVLSWSDPPLAGESDQILIYPSAVKIPVLGTVLSVQELNDARPLPLGVGVKAGRITTHKLMFGEHQLVVVRVLEQLVRVGPSLKLSKLIPLSDFALRQMEDGAEATWGWPDGCEMARLSLQIDRAAPTLLTIERSGAASSARHAVDARPPCHIKAEIKAMARADGPFSSPTKVSLSIKTPNTLTFNVELVRAGGLFSRSKPRIMLQLNLEKPEVFPSLEVRYSPNFKPGPNEGELLTLVSWDTIRSEAPSLDLTEKLGPRRGFINVIPVDAEDAARMMVVPRRYTI